MKRKIRLFFTSILTLLIVLVLLFIGYYYYTTSQNQIINRPVTKSPQALKLTKILNDAGFTYKSPPSESNGVITASISGSLVLFSSSKNLKMQVKALQLLTRSLKMDGQDPKEIDLRFSKVIVRY